MKRKMNEPMVSGGPCEGCEGLRAVVAAWDDGWDCSAHPGHLAVGAAVEAARRALE